MTDTREELARLSRAVRDRFDAEKRVLSFAEYLELVGEHPWRHTREAARYLRDCFDYYGTTEVSRPFGVQTHYRIFDLPFEQVDENRRRDHLVGHENVQGQVYRALQNFVREGRPNRLILLHGPNGSAKSTFVACLMRALEDYSTRDEGAVYRFSWIFPRGRDGKKGIGFDADELALTGGTGSYAHLPEDRIEVKIQSGLREHPLLLLPLSERRRFVERAYQRKSVSESPPDWVWYGHLGQKNRQIFEALLTAYRGDIERVLAHVQVERYAVSRRYRVGAVTIGPQMAVDAHERQLTADHSLNSLPASLSALTLFEPFGELVDASGGIVEYSDLLKRPLDAWKYLLLAIETGEVSLPFSNLPINAVMIASSNDLHLNAFKEHHEYNSFRGRLQFVRVPYLVDYLQEQGIYDAQIVPQVRRHVAPHASFVAALWAVLTRLQRPQVDRYADTALGRVAADITPMEKAELYARGVVPSRLGNDEARTLRNGIRYVWEETDASPHYEGLTGASPREIRALLLDAAHDPAHDCLSPLAVLDRIEAFCQRNDYDFLKQTPDRGYHDHRGFIAQVRQKWLALVDDELRLSTGMVDETQHHELFDRYVTHVSFWIKNERVYNRVTGRYEDPDVELMESVESMLEVQDAEEFRRHLISTVAGHALDNPGKKVDYASLFPRYIERVRDAYYGERHKQIGTIAKDVLTLLEDGARLEPERRAKAKETLETLKSRFGYADVSVRLALGELVRERYAV